jgi:hypothetical protein
MGRAIRYKVADEGHIPTRPDALERGRLVLRMLNELLRELFPPRDDAAVNPDLLLAMVALMKRAPNVLQPVTFPTSTTGPRRVSLARVTMVDLKAPGKLGCLELRGAPGATRRAPAAPTRRRGSRPMPRPATGQVLHIADGYAARVRIGAGPNDRECFELAVFDEAGAENRAALRAALASKLRRVAGVDETRVVLEEAGNARTAEDLAEVQTAADAVINDVTPRRPASTRLRTRR